MEMLGNDVVLSVETYLWARISFRRSLRFGCDRPAASQLKSPHARHEGSTIPVPGGAGSRMTQPATSISSSCQLLDFAGAERLERHGVDWLLPNKNFLSVKSWV